MTALLGTFGMVLIGVLFGLLIYWLFRVFEGPYGSE